LLVGVVQQKQGLSGHRLTNQPDQSGDDELNHMRLKVRKGHSQAHLVRLLGEPDYCVGEYLECRYASDKSCITDGLPGVLALVIWFDDNRVGNHEIMCVRE